MARKSKNSTKAERRAWLPERAKVARVMATTTTIALFLVMAIGLVGGRSTLRARAAEVVREPVSVKFDWPPLAAGPDGESRTGTWLDPRTQHQLTALALNRLTADPFDAESLARAREALARTGWFAEGPVLRRESAGVVRVEGKWRVPFAAVRDGTTDHLVTYRGELLDMPYGAGTSGFPVIVGASQRRPERLGEVWAGPDVHAGLRLLTTLSSRPWYKQIAAVDVSEYLPKNRRELTIVAKKTGGRIRWGGPADSPLPGEATTAMKIRHIDNVVAQHGWIDAGQTHLDIRFKDVFVDNGAVQSGR